MITVGRDADAGVERLWAVLVEPESWPRWTSSMTSVELLDGALRSGARARIVQPGLRPAVWTVTEFEPGTSFTWTSTSGGVTTTGTHAVRSLGPGRSSVELGLTQTGLLAPVVRLLLGRRMHDFVTREADGLAAAAAAGE